MLLFLTACTSHTAKNDADAVVPDGNVPTVDDAVETEADDFIFVGADEIIPDADTAEPDCPPLATAQFPYYQNDGTIHFCRKCDLPAKTDDPQCVRNLWSAANQKMSGAHPEVDCSPYPCVVEGMKPFVFPNDVPDSECDINIQPNDDVERNYYIENGKVFFMLVRHLTDESYPFQYPCAISVTEFDIASHEYRIIAPSVSAFANYKNGTYYFIAKDYNNVKDLNSFKSANDYLISYTNQAGYRVIYNKPLQDRMWFPYVGKNWLFISIAEDEGGQFKQLYAKIGTWQWHEIGINAVYSYASISGDMMALSGDQTYYTGYVCDLSKLPKSVSDCRKVGESGELIYSVEIDANDPQRFIYTTVDPDAPEKTAKFFEIKSSNGTWTRTEYLPTSVEPQHIVMAPNMVKGDLMTYNELLPSTNPSYSYDSKICYYRFSTKKSHCMERWNNPSSNTYDMTRSKFDGYYLTWMRYNIPRVQMRDMQCYCKKAPASCPFEGLK